MSAGCGRSCRRSMRRCPLGAGADGLLRHLPALVPGFDAAAACDVVTAGAARGLTPGWALVRAGLVDAAQIGGAAAVACGMPVLDAAAVAVVDPAALDRNS